MALLEDKSLEELRALAKRRGLKGYSKLRKPELLHLLSGADKTAGKPRKAKPKQAPSQTRRAPAKTTPARTGKKTTAPPGGRPSVERPVTPPLRSVSEEEQVESAKYAVTLPGVELPTQARAGDLAEDIDRLPDFSAPVLCLLPQKPGVLHAYWALPSDTLTRLPALKLRLCTVMDGGFQVMQETALPANRGHWYFHVDPGLTDTAFYLQLGQYQNGEFVLALPRGIARIPSLYASDRSDRLWLISEAQFREMYLRAGGRIEGGKLGWSASVSSWPTSPGVSSR